MEKIIKGFENYSISSDGYVINNKTNQKLKGAVKKSGYVEVNLGSGKKYFLLHRLVAEYFCEKQDGCNEINHKDGNKTNNHYENLEWVDRYRNLKHAYINGLRKDDVSPKKVVGTHMITGEKIFFNSIYQAARKLNISQGNICMCCQNKRPYANGYFWNYE